ncbi:uncharacterized protein LOC132705797 [Cylas formicarius]|uniref:uncharacterized protein LOC132705797 n=1 Tax=Cylas formicarius TaxID=197179 RepID=UPI00295867FD|nr:uncharacterized protein LOC132705797 [Cylas formicarius]
MSVILRLLQNALHSSKQPLALGASNFHSLVPNSNPGVLTGANLFSIPSRSVIRVHFPRPSETKRIKRHGWRKRMSTPAGRRILMNRILKGRWVYSH